MTQDTLLSRYNPPAFAGETFDETHDEQRLTGQLARVRTLMLDGKWRTLAEIATAAQGSEAAVSARLRDLRKPDLGGYQIDRKRVGDPRAGLWAYRMAPADNQE